MEIIIQEVHAEKCLLYKSLLYCHNLIKDMQVVEIRNLFCVLSLKYYNSQVIPMKFHSKLACDPVKIFIIFSSRITYRT